MSDEKDNVVHIGASKTEENVLEINKYENLKQLIERSVGSNYVFCYIREEDGAPCIVPSEKMGTMEMVYLGELMKTIALSSLGIEGLDE